MTVPMLTRDQAGAAVKAAVAERDAIQANLLELDSSFAMAHEELGTAYMGLREAELAKASYQNAFDLKGRASEIEKLRISANYYLLLGNFMEAAHSYQVWAQTYPQDWEPWANLSTLYARMSRYPDAIQAGAEALRLNPEHAKSPAVWKGQPEHQRALLLRRRAPVPLWRRRRGQRHPVVRCE